jgi:protein O-GlcNAc transferase
MRRGFRILPVLLLVSCATTSRDQDLSVEYYNLGNTYFELSQLDKAVGAYRTALRHDSGNTKASYNLALALGKAGRAEEAEAVLEQILAEDPTNVETMEALAWAKSTAGADGEALAVYERILAASAENTNAWYNSGVLLWKAGKKEEAAERFRTLLRYSPEDPPGMYNLGELLLSMDQAAEAAEFLSRYGQKKPEDTGASLLLARCQERLSSFAKALELYEFVLGVDGRNAKALFGKANLLLTEIEDPDKGLASLQQALDLGFTDAEAIRHLLESPLLLERDAVEKLLSAKKLMPEKSGSGSAKEASPSADEGEASGH